jgi:predicted transcriptional regulator
MLDAIWKMGTGTVHETSSHLSAKLSAQSVATQLNRLVKKGLLRRRKVGRAFIYSATISPREMEDTRAAELVRRVFSESNEHPEVLLSCLVDAVHQYDTELLNQLEAKIEQKKRFFLD